MPSGAISPGALKKSCSGMGMPTYSGVPNPAACSLPNSSGVSVNSFALSMLISLRSEQSAGSQSNLSLIFA